MFAPALSTPLLTPHTHHPPQRSPNNNTNQWGWFDSRSYHHTGMVSMCYAMREALRLVAEEGLEPMWAR
jgi:aspartate aminotransferase-like enzyme